MEVLVGVVPPSWMFSRYGCISNWEKWVFSRTLIPSWRRVLSGRCFNFILILSAFSNEQGIFWVYSQSPICESMSRCAEDRVCVNLWSQIIQNVNRVQNSFWWVPNASTKRLIISFATFILAIKLGSMASIELVPLHCQENAPRRKSSGELWAYFKIFKGCLYLS